MSQQKIGVLLVNLGTPEHPTAPAIRKFLKPFLADSRVIDYPKFLWKPILYSFILPFRPRKVKPLYQHVWTNEGSPLYANAIGQEKALQAHFDQSEHGVLVRATMAYSKPSISDVVDEFLKEKVAKMIVLPLFPQYSSTTTAAIFDAFAQSLKKKKDIPPFDFIHHYYERPSYIQALAQTIRLQENEHLLFSFHGIPQRYVIEGDYYTEHCQQTAQLLRLLLAYLRSNGRYPINHVLDLRSGRVLIPMKPLFSFLSKARKSLLLFVRVLLLIVWKRWKKLI